ncbi:MAG: hypothetical protein JO212_18025 [Acetobacteraceae bacterium]|nr:hypothetical protein [Acetobacteraceae bacterium]
MSGVPSGGGSTPSQAARMLSLLTRLQDRERIEEQRIARRGKNWLTG